MRITPTKTGACSSLHLLHAPQRTVVQPLPWTSKCIVSHALVMISENVEIGGMCHPTRTSRKGLFAQYSCGCLCADFPHDQRDTIFQRLFQILPNDAGRISNHVFFRERSAKREAARQVCRRAPLSP